MSEQPPDRLACGIPAGHPRVSVVIPAYNPGRFIDAAVGSALSQSMSELEVIVVNDGSTDDTSDRLAAWNDPRLRVITQAHGGLASALNTAIRASRGEYIAFLDADDVWLPDKLARHFRVHEEQTGMDATFSWVRVIDGNGNLTPMPCPRWHGCISFSQLLVDYAIRTMSAVVVRRAAAEHAGMFDADLVRCVDFEFFLRVARLRPNNICAVPEVLSLYRRHEKQRTRDWRLMQEGWNQLLGLTRQRAPRETAAVEKRASSNMLRYFAAVAYQSGSFRDSFRLIRESFRVSPAAFVRDSRNWVMTAVALASLTLPRRALLACERIAGFERCAEGPAGSAGPSTLS